MFSFRTSLALFFSAALMAAPAFAIRTTHKSTPGTAHKVPVRGRSRGSSKTSGRAAKSHKLHGQQVIDSNRVTEIQQALIREHYLNGEASGNWDSTTQAAMAKYQSDQGWQTRLTPDSRALKKLGLGPDYSTAINANGSAFAAPAPASSIPAAQAAGFAAASRVNQ